MEQIKLKFFHKSALYQKANGAIILITVVCVAVIVFFLHLNEIIISIRIKELYNYLYNLEINNINTNHIELIATYEIHKKLYEERITQDNADAIIQKISDLAHYNIRKDESKQIVTYRLTKPALFIINCNRKVLGKPPINIRNESSEMIDNLTDAYYYERNLLFKQAVAQYTKALAAPNLNDQLKSSILLRQGYCYALLGENSKARHNYKTILNQYTDQSSAITASILSKYLDSFVLAQNKILANKIDPLIKSDKLLNLLAYKQALNIITQVEKDGTISDQAQIEYFKARCYSGLGRSQEAVTHYLKAITKNPDSVYAKYSNRKLYLLGTKSGPKSSITKTAQELNKVLNDPVLSKVIENSNIRTSSATEPAIAIDLAVPDTMKDFVKKVTSNTEAQKDSSSNILQTGNFLTIHTIDGNIFKGTLLRKTSDNITLKTTIGQIDIQRKSIKKITGTP